MKIPSFQRISEETLDTDDLTVLAEVLNRPLSTLTLALQGRLTFGENIIGSVQSITLDGQYPKLIQNPLPTTPQGITPIHTDKPALVTAAPWINWELTGNQIKITSVLGTNPTQSNKLKIKVLII